MLLVHTLSWLELNHDTNKNFAAVTPRTNRAARSNFPTAYNVIVLLYCIPCRVVFGAHDNRFHYIRRAELENSAHIWGIAVDLYVNVVWL